MSKSIVQMLNELFARVDALEKRVAAPQRIVEEVGAPPPAAVAATRAMCPHCGVKPNHFFHVKYCLEKNKNNGPTLPRRDQNTP